MVAGEPTEAANTEDLLVPSSSYQSSSLSSDADAKYKTGKHYDSRLHIMKV